jgi:hypothetical protein
MHPVARVTHPNFNACIPSASHRSVTPTLQFRSSTPAVARSQVPYYVDVTTAMSSFTLHGPVAGGAYCDY